MYGLNVKMHVSFLDKLVSVWCSGGENAALRLAWS